MKSDTNIERGCSIVKEPGMLDRITDRISNAARVARANGDTLNEHADRVHGAIPYGRETDEVSEPSAAIDRIWEALDRLDAAQSYMTDAAIRNCTLA